MTRDPAIDLLHRAKRHFDRVAEGEDVPNNVQQGVAVIAKIALELDTSAVTLETIANVSSALRRAIKPALETFGSSPSPDAVETGLRSADDILRTFGTPEADWSSDQLVGFADWVDHVLGLIAETEAARHRRRIAARARRRAAGSEVTTSASTAIH